MGPRGPGGFPNGRPAGRFLSQPPRSGGRPGGRPYGFRSDCPGNAPGGGLRSRRAGRSSPGAGPDGRSAGGRSGDGGATGPSSEGGTVFSGGGPGRSLRWFSAKRRRFSSRGTLNRSRGSLCSPPGRQSRGRRSSDGGRLVPGAGRRFANASARSTSCDSQRRPRANHFITASGWRTCSCRSVGISSSSVCARKAVGFPSRMIVQ
jgi:hypothetical protein